MQPTEKATPFVKWVGGKRSLIKVLLECAPTSYQHYYEPFVGGGALFFALNPKIATLADCNLDLIITYAVVKNNPYKLIKSLQNHQKKHNEKHYYSTRKKHQLQDSIEIASRFIYLNKTCYNGLYRVNSKGEFNVPVGRYDSPAIVNETNIIECSKRLTNTTIHYYDFKQSLLLPQKDDFVYLDPPYNKVNCTSFTKYTKYNFTEDNQKELYHCCKDLDQRGVKFLLSNSDTPYITEMYKDFDIQKLTAPRMVNCKANGRNAAKEVLIRNYT